MMWELPVYKPRGVRCVLLNVVRRVRHQPLPIADEYRNPAATPVDESTGVTHSRGLVVTPPSDSGSNQEPA